jgi:hypothetical protein
MTKDRSLQFLQAETGFDPELLAECPTSAAIRLERLGLTTASVEGDHQLGAQAFTVGIRGHEALKLDDERTVTSESEVRFDPGLECGQSELLQTSYLGLGERFECEVCKGMAPPEREGIPKRLRSPLRLSGREFLSALL